MTRRPFDPSRMAFRAPPGLFSPPASAPPGPAVPPGAPTGAPEGSGEAPITVTQLGALIDGALRAGLARTIRVVGEISGFRERTHWYFDLKDEGAVINCVMFASAAKRAGVSPQTGMRVVLTGRVEFYGAQGRTQFYVEKLETVGDGPMEAQFRRLCEELRALGWFDPARKRALPRFPGRIAVITSRSAAALQDVLDTLRRRWRAAEIVLIDVRVQGAAAEVAGALRRISGTPGHFGIDTIILTRGGGSREDLWSFNDRDLATAILESAVPVVAAIGHETDVTIAELVADERAATPTQAAMKAAPDAVAVLEQFDALGRRLRAGLLRRAALEAERLRAAWRHPFFTDPRSVTERPRERCEGAAGALSGAVRHLVVDRARRLETLSLALERNRPAALAAQRRERLIQSAEELRGAIRSRLGSTPTKELDQRLKTAHQHLLRSARERLDAVARALELVGPAGVLARGYSFTFKADGGLVRSTGDVKDGETVRTRVRDGTFDSVVQGPPGRGSAAGFDAGGSKEPDQIEVDQGTGRQPVGPFPNGRVTSAL